MKLQQILQSSLMAGAALLMAGSLHATSVTGEANIAGNVNVSANSIVFAPQFTTTAGATETGSFAGLTGGTIMSLFNGPTAGNVSIPGFMTFSTGLATPIIFDLDYIAPGVGTAAACGTVQLGAVCTPTNSPFTLVQLSSDTVIASLQMNGTAYAGSRDTGTSFTKGIFSTQTVVNGTVPGILAALASNNTITGITYSASFNATPNVPEPASMLLMGLGLVGAGIAARRKAVSK